MDTDDNQGEVPALSSFEQSEVCSLKEIYFHQQGEHFLLQWRHWKFSADTRSLLGYEEVRQSWRSAIQTVPMVPLPKGLKPSSVKEQEQLELFLMALRHWPLSKTYEIYGQIADQWSTNQLFLDTVAKITRHRLIPDQTPLPLEHWLLAGWLHWSLWLLDNDDRVILLQDIFGLENVSVDRVRKVARKLALKDWSDFQPKFTPAPFYLQFHYDENGQKVCQILPRLVGQF